MKIPANMKAAKICMTWSSQGDASVFVAPRVRCGPMRIWATIAPTLPEAAEIPWEVDRYLVGKHSPGTMKVVALGPKLKKNWQSTYRMSSAVELRLWNANPMMQKRAVRMVNPIS